MTVSLFNKMIDYNPKIFDETRVILIGGETVLPKTVNILKDNSPHVKIINVYGPTENSDLSSCHIIEKRYEKSVPIGIPVSNSTCYILDKNQNLLPVGVPGEICVGGDGVAIGYLNNEKMTAEKFIPNKFGKGKLYRTGDLGYWEEDGTIQFVSRIDDQVKIRGFRIELKEIETKIIEFGDIQECAVIIAQNNSSKILVACIGTKKQLDPKEINAYLKTKLPFYMIPSKYMFMENLPLNINGKLDTKKLLKQLSDMPEEIIKPTNEMESELVRIWEEVLDIQNVGINQTFFEIGGDSLSAITLSELVYEKYHIKVPVKNILNNLTIEDLANFIKNSQVLQTLNIKRAPKREVYPLSSAQRRIYYACKMSGENSILYNVTGGILVNGILDKSKIETSFERILQRHSVLRTGFILQDEEVVQKVFDNVKLDITSYKNTQNEIEQILADFPKPFNLEEAPLFRVQVNFIDNKQTLILIDSHHIVIDGTGINNLFYDFNKIYCGEKLEPLPIQYIDYSVWENNFNKSDEIKKLEDYWINKFKDSDFAQLNLPYDNNVVNSTYNGNTISKVVDKDLFVKIEDYAKQLNVSPYMLCLSVLFILLYKYTGQTDINIGTPVANRELNETKNMIGMFVNNIVLRGKVNTDETFLSFISEIKNQVLNDLSNQAYPFDMLVKKLKLNNILQNSTLFDVMFMYQSQEISNMRIDEKDCTIVDFDNKTSKFNLSLEVRPVSNTIKVEYCTDLFKKQTVKRFLEHYINTLKYIIENKDVKIKDIQVISNTEKNKILYEFNNTKIEYEKNSDVIELFEAQVKKTPNKIAVIFEDEKMTYSELNEKANKLANYLKNNGVNSNEIVGIMLPRSIELISTILGVKKSGACYLPIDPTYPAQRIEYMLKNSEAKVLITNDELYNNIKYPNKISANYTNMEIYSENSVNVEREICGEDLAYVIYTSGSTGLPKGVKITNSNLYNFIIGLKEKIDFSEDKTMVSVTTISFDIFGLEIWGSLTSGMTLVVANENEQHIPTLLNKLCIKNNVDMIQTTPSRYSLMFDEIENTEFLKGVKDILVGGEPIDEDLLYKMQECSNAKIFNLYGPTETTIWSTVKDLSEEKMITIGKPIANTEVYVLDNNLQPVPIGVSGELYIAGDGVGKGYLNREDITNERYIKNPYLENSIMYKTGDICKFKYNGELICLGRIDNQIKIRGLRIELEEIEKKILEFPGINKAKVIKQTIGNREILSAYFIAKRRIKNTELRSFLYKYLPNYMIPSYFTALDKFPYTPNGKIDKNALPIPNGMLKTEEKTYIPPKSDLEVKLVSMWEEVLNTKPIGVKDNFFELGGDSILAMNLNIKLLKITNKIKYSDIFSYPTISKLAEKIERGIEEEQEDLSYLNNQYLDILNNNMVAPKEIQNNLMGNVLLTGVTGFLGIHILEELLNKEKGKIFVIVRKDAGSTVKEKLLNKMHYYFGDKYDSYIDRRIIIIQGEVSEDGFSLNQEELFKLGNNVNTIINSVANVSHYGNYSDFYNSNVKSVEKIISFANTFNLKVFHISTLSVSGNAFIDQYYMYQDFKEDVIFDESKYYIGQNLENVYVRSKFEAERVLLDAISKGTDAYILRVGNLMPRLSDGKFQDNINDNAYISRLKAFIDIGCIPDYLKDAYLEFTPIDSTAKAIIKIIQHTNNTNKIYHIFNHNHVYIEDLLKILPQLNYNLDVVDNMVFKQKIRDILSSANSNILNALINDLDKDLDLNYDSKIKLKSDFSIQLLKQYGFRWPKINKDYILNILKLIKGEKDNDSK